MDADLQFALPPMERSFLDAAKVGDVGMLRDLHAKGTPVDVLDNRELPWGQTALFHAAQGGHLEAVCFLLSAGARVSTKDRGDHEVDRNRQPLHYAMLSKNVAVAEALLDAHANPNSESHFGVTPLNVAIEKQNIEGVRLLLRQGANVNLKAHSRHYTPPLSLAASVKNSALVRLLIEAGANVNAADARGQTPLMSAGMGGRPSGGTTSTGSSVSIIEDLVKAGANVNHVGDGRTALSLAVIFGDIEASRALLRAGAHTNLNYDHLNGTLVDAVEQRIRTNQKDVGTEVDIETGAATMRLHQWEKMLSLLCEFGGKRKSELD